jgi:hypothetical protein
MLRVGWGSIPCMWYCLVFQGTSSIILIVVVERHSMDGIFLFLLYRCALFHYFPFLIRWVSLKVWEFIYLRILRNYNSFKSQDENSGWQLNSWLVFIENSSGGPGSIHWSCRSVIQTDRIFCFHCICARWFNNLFLMTYPQVWNRSVN